MAISATQGAGGKAAARPMTPEERKVILASSLGTVFEWYDFYLYGTLAVIIGNQFFSAVFARTESVVAGDAGQSRRALPGLGPAPFPPLRPL